MIYHRNKPIIKQERRLYCRECKQSFDNQSGLDIHRTRDVHLNKINGKEKSAEAQRAEKKRAKARASKQHHCPLCPYTADSNWPFQKHEETGKHKTRLREALEEAQRAAATP